MTEQEQQREYRTVSYLVSTLANICAASPNMVIDALTGLLWDDEEAGQIKEANMMANALAQADAACGVSPGAEC